MQNLIDKLGETAGADRVLDVEIHLAVFGNPSFGWKGPSGREVASTLREYLDAFRSVIDEDDAIPADVVPYYTASIDGAAKLIPEDMYWLAGVGRDSPEEPLGGAQVIHPETDEELGGGEAPTVPLALCIAALEARLSLQPQ